MARARKPPGGGGGGGGHHSYIWMFRCYWIDPDGHHTYSKLHSVVRPDATNYQGAAYQARREVHQGLSESERELEARNPGLRFTCSREGPVIRRY